MASLMSRRRLPPGKSQRGVPTWQRQSWGAVRVLPLVLLIAMIACAGRVTRSLRFSSTTPSPVVSLLERMPADDVTSENELGLRLLNLDEASFQYLCNMLGQWGTDDDESARYALAAATRYAQRPDANEHRLAYERRLLDCLGQDTGLESRRFFIRQLQLVGSDASARRLADLLTHRGLVAAATRALRSIGGPVAENALYKALDSGAREGRVHILTALGELRSTGVAEIVAFLADEDEQVRAAALYALERSRSADVGGALWSAYEQAGGRNRDRLLAAYMRHERQRIEAGGDGPAAARVMHLLERGNMPPQHTVAALEMLAALLGAEALPLLKKAESEATIAGTELKVLSQNEAVPMVDSISASEEAEDPDAGLPRATQTRAIAIAARRLWEKIEMKEALARMVEEELLQGFVPLFDGKSLRGWTGDMVSYIVEDGKIVVDPRRGDGGGNLFTENEYADFILRLEFRLTPGANNGLGIRASLDGDAAYRGMELQILDDGAAIYANLEPYQYHGSIYGVVPALRGHQRPVGQWNNQEVIARGRQVTVILNGVTIVDADIDEASSPETMDGRDHPGLERTSGHIGFLGHGDRVEFRNIRIRDLH